MRSLDDLDHEIRATEARLAERRLALNRDLQASRERTRRSLGSPGMLIGAFVAGFAIERLGRLRPRRGANSAGSIQRTGVAGLAAGLGAAAVRAVLSNPQLWHSLQTMWARRRRTGSTAGVRPGFDPYAVQDDPRFPTAGGK